MPYECVCLLSIDSCSESREAGVCVEHRTEAGRFTTVASTPCQALIDEAVPGVYLSRPAVLHQDCSRLCVSFGARMHCRSWEEQYAF